MQDNFVADIGDYFKYSLLRYLSGMGADDSHPSFSLGVMWYYTQLTKASEGQKIKYLTKKAQPDFIAFDTPLYGALRDIEKNNTRTIKAVEASGIFSPTIKFFSDELSYKDIGAPDIIRHRQQWFQKGLAAMAGQDIVFFDPDTGIEIKSCGIRTKKAPQYCYFDELEKFWQAGQSLIIYQHSHLLNPKRIPQIQEKMQALHDRLGAAHIESVFFPSHSGRMFIVVSQPQHHQSIGERIQGFIQKAKALPDTDQPSHHTFTLALAGGRL